VQLKVRYSDFATITRASTFPAPTDLAADLARSALALLEAVEIGAGIRLLGVSGMAVEDAAAVQTQLSFDATPTHVADLERTIDAVRERFGADAVGRAAHSAGGRLRTDRRGSLWGPDDEEGT
jgi:DNA polymerase-4